MKPTLAIAATALLTLGASATPFKTRFNPGKKGSAFVNAAAIGPLASTVSWAYGWAPAPDTAVPQGVEFVPMLFSTDPNHANNWNTLAKQAIANGATAILGFNEPDLASQANLSPADAAAAWLTNIEPFAGQVTLVSPAITNGPPPSMGTGWMEQFLGNCSTCTIDAIAIHVYDSATNIPYFQSYIPGVAAQFNKPVWVSEFAGSGTPDEEEAFIKTMIPFLDAQPQVQRYAYFATIEGNLVANSAVTRNGAAYQSAN